MSSHLRIEVDSIPVRLFAQEPEPAPDGKTYPAIVLLHGAGGNLDFWTSRLAPYLHQANVALYAPHYFDRTNTTYADLATIQNGIHTAPWLGVADEAVRFASTRPGVNPQQIILAGVSLGAFLALALAAQFSAAPDSTQRTRLRALIDVSGGLVEPYASQATSHFPPTLILHGATDTIVPATYAHKIDQRLTDLDVAHRTEILSNEGHWFSSSVVPRILLAVANFLGDHLQNPSTPERAM